MARWSSSGRAFEEVFPATPGPDTRDMLEVLWDRLRNGRVGMWKGEVHVVELCCPHAARANNLQANHSRSQPCSNFNTWQGLLCQDSSPGKDATLYVILPIFYYNSYAI